MDTASAPGGFTMSRRPSRFWFGFASVVSAAIVTVVACAPRQPSPGAGIGTTQLSPVKGGVFVDAGISDATTLQPVLVTDVNSRLLTELHYNAPLLRLNPDTLDYETKYGVAESFAMSPDGLEITFKLKPDVVWSDGTPLTADDYAFTFDKYRDPKVDFPSRSNWAQVAEAVALNPRTLVFRLKEPSCPILSLAGEMNPIPKHVFESVDLMDNPFNQKPVVGSGPWLLQEWSRDNRAVFVANERFFLGRPNLDSYQYRVVKDQSVAVSLLKTGEIDRWSGIRAEDIEDVKSQSGIQLHEYYSAKPSWTFIGFNYKNDILNDLKVRQALASAVDRQKMIDRIRMGKARPVDSAFTPSSWAYAADVPKIDFNLDKARKLLDEAGWKVPAGDANGIRVKDGKPLQLRLHFNTGNKDREGIAIVAQDSFRKIGVDAEVISEEFGAYVNRVNKTKDVDMFILGFTSGVEPNGSGSTWRSDSAGNPTGFANAKVDDLFKKAAVVTSCDQNERKALYGEAQKLIAADSPFIFLWENQVIEGVNERLVTNPASKLGIDYRKWEWFSKTGR